MAKDIFVSSVFDSIANDIAARIRAKLLARAPNASPADAILIRLSAIQIAHAQLALIREWLHTLEPCSPQQLALLLHRSSVAMARAIVTEP